MKNHLSAVIVDDEIQSHHVLKALLSKNHPEIEILGSGMNVEEGYELITKYKPELVFLDIEMPDGTGFDLLQKIGDHNFQVIFITAFNQYAITAIKFGAIDYIEKPPSKETLAKSIELAFIRRAKYVTKEQMEILWETLRNLTNKKLPSRTAVYASDGIHYMHVNNIVRLEAHQNYTRFILANPKNNTFHKILASINLGEYETQFEPYYTFMRVHRSHLVNLEYVDMYVKADGGYLLMKDGAQVPVSRSKKDELLGRLDKL